MHTLRVIHRLTEKLYTLKISVKKSLQKNKFWVHHIYININSTQLIAGDNQAKTNNVYTFDSVNGVGKYTVNYGGVFGYVENNQIKNINYKGDIDFANKQKPNNIDANVGGIIGYGINSSLEQANVNDYWMLQDSKFERHTVTKANNVKYSINVNAYSPESSKQSVSVNVGGVIGSGTEFKCVGSQVT